MAFYEIDATKLGAKTYKKLTDIAMQFVFDPVGGRLFGRTDEKLPRSEGLHEVSQAEFQLAVPARRGPAAPTKPALAGAARLEASSQWRVAPKSPRKATLHWVATAGDEQVLGVELGEGRGDRVEIMRPVLQGLRITGVSVDVQPTVDLSEQFALSVVLTSTSERPWVEKGPARAEPRVWTTLTFDFSDTDDVKRLRVDQLLLVLHTQADEGLCLIKNLSLLG